MKNNIFKYENYKIDYILQGKRYEKKVIIRESNDGPKWTPKFNFLRARSDFASKHLHDEILAVIYLEA